MSRASNRAIAAAVGAVCMLLATPGEARDREPRVASFAAVATCPTEASFTAEVRRRAARAEDASPSFRVTVEARGGDRFRGRIVVEREGGDAAERVVDGASCEEVMHALALVAALSIDPEGGGRERAEEESAGASAGASTSAEAGAEAGASAKAGASAEAGTGAGAGPERSVAVSVGVHAAAQEGVAPGVVVTVPVFVEIAFGRREAEGSLRGRVAPAVRLAFVHGSGDAAVADHGTASFTWTAGEIDLCPVIVEVARLSLSPCARMELGALNGAGRNVDPPRSETRVWAALAVPVRLRLRATRSLFVEIEGVPRVPLQRERFVFQPDITVFRAPAMAWSAGAGAGITFP